MPVQSYQIPGGARVLLFTCEGCGKPACFGVDADPLAALRTGIVAKAGRWYCGWGDGTPFCKSSEKISESMQGSTLSKPQPNIPENIPDLFGGLT